MSRYDNLIDALDEFREAREEQRRELGYDPHNYTKNSRKERLDAAEEKLDVAFTTIVNDAIADVLREKGIK